MNYQDIPLDRKGGMWHQSLKSTDGQGVEVNLYHRDDETAIIVWSAGVWHASYYRGTTVHSATGAYRTTACSALAKKISADRAARQLLAAA